MKSASNSETTLQVLGAILPVILLPIGGLLLAVIITYFRRRQQARSNPQIRFDKPLWRATIDTFGAIILIWAVLYFLFPLQNNQIRFSPQFGWLFANPIYAIALIIFIPIVLSGVFLLYLISGVKPLLYRGDYERALKFVRRWKWLPIMQNILTNLEGSILQFYGRYTEAEACNRIVEQRTAKANKKERQSQGSNLGNLGWALVRQARYAEALDTFQQSIEFYPEGADNFSGLGETLLWMGKPEDALQYLERGIENKRYRMNVDRYVWGELLANQAWAQAQLGSYDQALKTYKQALAETEQDCLPALAGIHVRGGYIFRLSGDEPQAIGEFNIALKLDPRGGYGQLAKAALQVPQERTGMTQLAIAADGAAVVRAIKQSTSAQRTIRVVRENLLLVAQGKDYSYIYLLRPQPDGSTILQGLLDKTASVETAFKNPDLKAGITGLMVNIKQTGNDTTYIAQHLKTIARAVSQTTTATESTEEKASPTPVGANTSDIASVFARKPLPSVTAKNRPAGGLNPSWYASMSFVMTPLLSSLILSFFWRRLGKPTWMWISMAFAILIPVVAIGGAVILARFVPSALQAVLILGGAGAWYGFSFALASLIEDPYQKWHQGGKEAIADYPYKWGRAALIGVGTVVAAMILGGVLNATRPGPQKFEHQLMTMTYPPSWTTGDVSEVKSCKKQLECFAWLYEKRFGYSNILFGRFSLKAVTSATNVEHDTWNNLTRQNSALTIETRDTIQISGLEAARRFYFYPSTNPKDTDLNYTMQIYMVRGQYAYYISAWSANKGIFEEDKSAIDGMLNSFVLKADVDDIPAKPVKWSYSNFNPVISTY